VTIKDATIEAVLSDGQRFKIEREFYCSDCGDWSDAHENQGDLLCANHHVIAAFRDREIIDNTTN